MMFDVIRRALFTGVGLAAMTKEKLVELGQDIARKADLTEAQAREFQDELARRADEARSTLEGEIDRRVEAVVAKLNLARSSELAELKARVEALELERRSI
jgi:polyhydroxyalkanoate synthesis regulator phasin